MKTRQAGRGMIGIIVGVVLVLVLSIVFATGSGIFGQKSVPERADGKGETLVGRSMLAGKDTQCRSNLGQVRQSIQINTDPVDNILPASLNDLRLGAEFLQCPVGKEQYVYDAQTGKVHCPHPGHEKY